MNEELFDIVDDQNQPTGIQKPRSIVHAEMNDWHRATHIWIVNKKNEVLCQQRSLSKDKNPGFWQSFFGGHLKAGQTYLENAVTELQEELGLSVTPDALIDVRILKSNKAKHFGQVYLLRWDGDINELKFVDDEVAAIQWMTMKEIKEKIEQGIFCNSIDPEVEAHIFKEVIGTAFL